MLYIVLYGYCDIKLLVPSTFSNMRCLRYDVFNLDCMFSFYAAWSDLRSPSSAASWEEQDVILYLLSGRKTRGTNKTRLAVEEDSPTQVSVRLEKTHKSGWREGLLAVILIDELSRCPEFLCWAKVENSSSLPAFKTSGWDFSNTISTGCC